MMMCRLHTVGEAEGKGWRGVGWDEIRGTAVKGQQDSTQELRNPFKRVCNQLLTVVPPVPVNGKPDMNYMMLVIPQPRNN